MDIESILSLLGGLRFTRLTGATLAANCRPGVLELRHKRGWSGISHTTVRADTEGTFSMKFWRKRGRSIEALFTVEGISPVDLERTFEANTGLRTSL